jgi:hypothetical protein
MGGVYMAIYVLTVTCSGQFCSGMLPEQRLEAPTAEACEFARSAVISASVPHRMISATCVGELRQVERADVRR